jgi:hypothetical protein
MSQAIRLSPSGPVITEIGFGMLLRRHEAQGVMTGNLVLPITTPGVVCYDGFTLATSPMRANLDLPKVDRYYGAQVWLDLWNQTTNVLGSVVIYLDTSVDGGATWVNRVANGHKVLPQFGADAARSGTARQVTLQLPMTSGNSLGVLPASTGLQVRARALCVAADAVLVDSLETVAGVSGLAGSMHIELNEYFADL